VPNLNVDKRIYMGVMKELMMDIEDMANTGYSPYQISFRTKIPLEAIEDVYYNIINEPKEEDNE
jgi:hypothetical protein